jgi:pyruvate/2-oxoglutarate dehydrogenase complex dihydrolipoamide dehydrogenase (E3) component
MNTDEAHFDLVIIGSGSDTPEATTEATTAGMRIALIERKSKTGETAVYTGKLTSQAVRAATAVLTAQNNGNLLQIDKTEQSVIAGLMTKLESVLSARRPEPDAKPRNANEVDPAIAAVWRDSIETEFDTLKAG